MSIQGKSALVTGAGRGLGKSIARAYASRGMRVMMLSLSGDELERSANEIRQTTGGEILYRSGDVSNQDDVSRTVDAMMNRFGTVDVLVNNAGIIGPARFIEDADPQSWNRTLRVNLDGLYLCSRAVLPAMKMQQGGKIINIVSGLGEMPFPRFCAYAVSKAGAIQFTRSIASEMKPWNIQVNAIDPGVMDTSMQDMIREMDASILGEEVHAEFMAYKRQNILNNPDDVAPLAVFLASGASDHLTGEIGTLRHYRRLGWNA